MVALEVEKAKPVIIREAHEKGGIAVETIEVLTSIHAPEYDMDFDAKDHAEIMIEYFIDHGFITIGRAYSNELKSNLVQSIEKHFLNKRGKIANIIGELLNERRKATVRNN